MNDIRHIIWDWNGTLLNDSVLCMDIMNNLLRRRGMQVLSWETYQEIFDFPVIDYYRRAGFDFEKESWEKVGMEFIDEYADRLPESRLQEDALSALSALKSAGYTQGVLSAYNQEALERALLAYDVRDYFRIVMGLDDHYAEGKVERGLQMLDELHVEPGQTLLVGDTRHDHEVAEAMGVHCVLLTTGSHSRKKLETRGVPVLDGLTDVTAYLLSSEFMP